MTKFIIISENKTSNMWSNVRLLALEGGLINYYVAKVPHIEGSSSNYAETYLKAQNGWRYKYVMLKKRASVALPADVVISALKKQWIDLN